MNLRTILTKYVGIGLLLLVVYLLVLFVISLIFGFEDSGTTPTVVPAVIFALLMGLICWGILLWLKPAGIRSAFGYSLSWAAIVFGLILIVTVANGTTATFLGPWYDWLSFIAIVISPVLLLIRKQIS